MRILFADSTCRQASFHDENRCRVHQPPCFEARCSRFYRTWVEAVISLLYGLQATNGGITLKHVTVSDSGTYIVEVTGHYANGTAFTQRRSLVLNVSESHVYDILCQVNDMLMISSGILLYRKLIYRTTRISNGTDFHFTARALLCKTKFTIRINGLCIRILEYISNNGYIERQNMSPSYSIYLVSTVFVIID